VDKTFTLLIADDEPCVRQLAAAILSQAGFKVLEAADGLEALSVAEQNPPDLLVTDILMPGLSGPELICRLKELGIRSRFLLISGYAGDALDKIHGLHERIPFLAKPFTPAHLIGKIREILGPAGCPLARAAA
jgi:two-component system, cell cycle sensor histidine kinase and response regulator CckA